MTIQTMDQVIGRYDAAVAVRAMAFDVQREAKSLLADPDGYSLSHLTDAQVEAVLTVAYNL